MSCFQDPACRLNVGCMSYFRFFGWVGGLGGLVRFCVCGNHRLKTKKKVVMKIIKHCQESFPLTVTGQLLGMDVENSLEISNCYPFPQVTTSSLVPREVEQHEEIDQSQYQMNMMRCVREVNIDHQVVGWYQSSGSQVRPIHHCCRFPSKTSPRQPSFVISPPRYLKPPRMGCTSGQNR